MPASFIQLPPDLSGKKQRTRSHVIGSDTVHEEMRIRVSERVNSGAYRYGFVFFIQVAAHLDTAPPQAFGWLYNPHDATSFIEINNVEYMTQLAESKSLPSSPRINLQRITVTGFSDASISGFPINQTMPASVGRIEVGNADANMGTTLEAAFFSFLPVASATNTIATHTWAASSDWNPPEKGQLILAAGEGIRVYQADAGTSGGSGDQGTARRCVVNLRWSEFTLP